jgi:Fur family transcriptional regulator, ferric uptake regulator
MKLLLEPTDQEKQVLVYVRGAGLNLTKNRRTILAVFLAGTQPVTIIDLWLQAKKADPRTSYGTVWRLLNALVEHGLAHREISAADGILRYGPMKVECAHEHIACKDCGATISQEGGQHDRLNE